MRYLHMSLENNVCNASKHNRTTGNPQNNPQPIMTQFLRSVRNSERAAPNAKVMEMYDAAFDS